MEFHALCPEVQLAFDQADYGQAIARLEQGLMAQPDRLEWAWYLGAALLLDGVCDEGQAVWFAAIAELDPSLMEEATAELVHVLLTIGERQHQFGFYHAATVLYEAVLELVGDSAEVHLIVGQLKAVRGDYEAAIVHWQTVTQLDSTLTAATLAMAAVHQKLGEWEAAIAAYQSVVARNPADFHAQYNLGLCYLSWQAPDAAIAHFKLALDDRPDESQILGDLAYALLQMGSLDAALSTFQRLRGHQLVTLHQQADPALANERTRLLSTLGSVDSLVPLGRSLLAAQDRKTAHMVAEAAIARFPDSADAQDLMNAVKMLPSNAIALPPSRDGVTAPRQAKLTADSGVAWTPIHPPSIVKLRSPKTLDEVVHFSFRFDGAISLPGSFVATLPNGRFWVDPDHSSCAVLTEENVLLSDLSPEFPILSPGSPIQSHRVLSTAKLSPYTHIDGTVAVLAGLSNDVYFHWLCDIVPRVELLRQSGVDWQAVDFVLVSDRLPFQREVLRQLEIPPEKVLSLQDYPHIQASHLVVPSFSGTVAWMSQPACDFVRSLYPGERFSQQEATPASDSPKRIYLSRQATANRRILNGSEVEALLHRRGFVSLTLEGYSVEEQATLLANAEIVVAPHGSGLTNLIFCQPGTGVIELFSPNYVYPCYWYLANLIGLDYYYVIGQQPEGVYLHRLLYPHPRLEDLWVNLSQLSAMLDLADAT